MRFTIIQIFSFSLNYQPSTCIVDARKGKGELIRYVQIDLTFILFDKKSGRAKGK